MVAQLNFELVPSNPLSLRYFVTHSGASDAVGILGRSVELVAEDPSAFQLVLLYGARGTGKTHLLRGFAERAIESGIDAERITCLDIRDLRGSGGEIDASSLASFIDRYEQLRTNGGLMFLEAADVPTAVHGWDPHLRSRLVAGNVVRLGYPLEQELRPLISSLAERRNLKLSESNIDFMLKWLPSDPLSFDRIITVINDASFQSRRSAGRKLIGEVLRESAGNR